MLRVIKRDGRVKDFDFKRITSAVEKAFREYAGTNEVFNKEWLMCYRDVIEQIECVIDVDCDNDISVELVQDIIVTVLRNNCADIADVYSSYRLDRTKYRDMKTNLMVSVEGLLKNSNIEVAKENSNKTSYLASTQRDLIAGEVSKTIARHTIPEHLMDAHDIGRMKIHDLDYFMQGIYNCELVNLKEMLQNGTVINKQLIEKPKSIRTAMTISTQIAAQVASSTYGGQTMSLSHLAPFVRISKEKITQKYLGMDLDITSSKLRHLVMEELKAEISDAVQTFNYQINTLCCTNGQSPFESICMYISEEPEYEEETVMLIEEFLTQRIKGMKNEYGVEATQTFPKLLYFLDENNAKPDSEYYWLTVLSAKATSKRMNPDYISVKKMKEIIGFAFPPMGCRAFVSPFTDERGDNIFYGRGNLGVQTINLPFAALEAVCSLRDFWKELDKSMELCREMCEIRYDKLKGIKADIAPILWQHGAISRLGPNDDIIKAVDDRGFTVTIGYSGLYETVKCLIGESHTTESGLKLAEQIMCYMRDKCEEFKQKQPWLRFALYGTPQESTTGWFNDKLVERFGAIEDITDKGWITNSYHVDIRENISAFDKLSLEAKLQAYSTGGAVSYIETNCMDKNVEGVLQLMDYMYENIIYAEINFESDTCGLCKYEGVMGNDPDTLDWVCPQCGNRDQKTLSVVRRSCGYLGVTEWTDARKKDILNRVKHI